MANNESTDVIREKVDSFEYKPQISSFGHVLKVGDGILVSLISLVKILLYFSIIGKMLA